MTSSLEKKYIDLMESMLETLIHNEDQGIEEQLKPLRIFIHDVGRFSSDRIFHSKFRAFVKTRDEQLLASVQKEVHRPSYDLTKKAIDHILDQVLQLLEKEMGSATSFNDDFKVIIHKLEEAKTINNIRALSEEFVRAGHEMVSKNQNFRDGLGQLGVELSFCKNQIRDLEMQLEHSREEAEKDYLTGQRNRRVFDRHLEESVARAHRFMSPLCLLLSDIDHFKQINDTYGHPVGDDVLINFSKLLTRSLRDFDLIYRLGGDEFAVLFSGCPLEKAKLIAERLRSYVTEHDYRVNKKQFSISISGGLVMLREGETAKDFFARGDALLYRAKKEGRRQICCE